MKHSPTLPSENDLAADADADADAETVNDTGDNSSPFIKRENELSKRRRTVLSLRAVNNIRGEILPPSLSSPR